MWTCSRVIDSRGFLFWFRLGGFWLQCGPVWCVSRGTGLVFCGNIVGFLSWGHACLFMCAYNPCVFLSHPSFVFLHPQCVSVGGSKASFLGALSNDLFSEAWLLQLRCLGDTMDKFRLICSCSAQCFVSRNAWAKGMGLHSWFSRKGGNGLCVAWVSVFGGGWVEGVVVCMPSSSNLPWGEIIRVGSIWDGWRVVQPIGLATLVLPTVRRSALMEGLGVQVVKNPSLGLSSIEITISPPMGMCWHSYPIPLSSREFHVLSWATYLKERSSGLCPCFSLWIVGFFLRLGNFSFRGVHFAAIPLFSHLAPLMYLSLVAFSSIECQPARTRLWILILDPR